MSIGQRLIFFSIVFSITIILQILVLKGFRNTLLRKNFNKSKLNTFITTILLFFNIPSILFLLLRMDVNDVPQIVYYIYIVPYYIYLGAMVFLGLFVLVLKIIKIPFYIVLFLLKRFKLLREKISIFKERKSIVKFDKSRRAFITYSGLFLTGYAFTGAGIGILSKDNYELTEKTIKLKNLPAELKGLKVALFSDVHSGPFMREDTMNIYANILNDLNADLILLPGDITNSNTDEAIPFTKSFVNLKSKYGVFATLGNHDYFSDPDKIEEIIIKYTSIVLLRNKAEILNINGKNLCIIGCEDTRDSGTGNNRTILGYIEKSIDEAKTKAERSQIDINNIPKILLCHKPYVFDYINEFNIDLMVSGHTHGGQVIFASLGKSTFSIASAVSRYVSGLFSNGDKHLYISRGIGTVGLPLRVNCPPEITIINLI